MSTGKYVLKSGLSSKYKTSTPFMSSSLSEKNHVSCNKKQKTFTTDHSLCIIPSEIPRIFVKDHFPFRSEYAVLTYDQYRDFPKGNGGFQGVVPWYVDQTGEIQFVLNISKGNHFLSYIGGGLRAKEKPIDSLYREISEETPQWSNYLISLLENPSYQKLVVVKDNYYLHYPSKNKGHIRLSTIIYLRVDPTIINETTFLPSSEVDRLYIIPYDELPFYTPVSNFIYNPNWEGTENGLSNGVNNVVEMIMNPTLFDYLWKEYIKKNITKLEYISYLIWLTEKNNVSNIIEWPNHDQSPQTSTRRSSSRSPRTSTRRSSSRSPKKLSKDNTHKNAKI